MAAGVSCGEAIDAGGEQALQLPADWKRHDGKRPVLELYGRYLNIHTFTPHS